MSQSNGTNISSTTVAPSLATTLSTALSSSSPSPTIDAQNQTSPNASQSSLPDSISSSSTLLSGSSTIFPTTQTSSMSSSVSITPTQTIKAPGATSVAVIPSGVAGNETTTPQPASTSSSNPTSPSLPSTSASLQNNLNISGNASDASVTGQGNAIQSIQTASATVIPSTIGALSLPTFPFIISAVILFVLIQVIYHYFRDKRAKRRNRRIK